MSSNSASGYRLATERAVMPIRGFGAATRRRRFGHFRHYGADGKDPLRRRPKFERRSGQGRGHPFAPTTVDGVALYDLTQ